MEPAGVIVAGGGSRRFGADKAMVDVAGLPMIARVAGVLRPECAVLAVNTRPASAAADWARSAGLPVLSDPPEAPEGPLAGIIAGLTWAAAQGADLLATAPCDTPWLPADLVARLCAALSSEAGVAIAACGEDLHPLCAVWRVDRAHIIGAATASGRHPPLYRLARELGGAVADFADPRAFANVNTPGDLS